MGLVMTKKNDEKKVSRTLEVDGRELEHIGTQNGIEFYQDKNSVRNTLYGINGYKVLFTIYGQSLDDSYVEFEMNTIDDESDGGDCER